MSKLFPIIALVGSTGCGKTALCVELSKRIPQYVSIIKSLTTRERRGPEDDIFYHKVTLEDILHRKAKGKLVQYLEYANNTYGTDREDIDSIIKEKFAIYGYAEKSILDLREAGYTVVPIKIEAQNIPLEKMKRDNLEKRKEEDHKRAQIQLDYVLTINNDFAPGGLEKAVQQLEDFVTGTLLKNYQNL